MTPAFLRLWLQEYFCGDASPFREVSLSLPPSLCYISENKPLPILPSLKLSLHLRLWSCSPSEMMAQVVTCPLWALRLNWWSPRRSSRRDHLSHGRQLPVESLGGNVGQGTIKIPSLEAIGIQPNGRAIFREKILCQRKIPHWAVRHYCCPRLALYASGRHYVHTEVELTKPPPYTQLAPMVAVWLQRTEVVDLKLAY